MSRDKPIDSYLMSTLIFVIQNFLLLWWQYRVVQLVYNVLYEIQFVQKKCATNCILVDMIYEQIFFIANIVVLGEMERMQSIGEECERRTEMPEKKYE